MNGLYYCIRQENKAYVRQRYPVDWDVPDVPDNPINGGWL